MGIISNTRFHSAIEKEIFDAAHIIISMIGLVDATPQKIAELANVHVDEVYSRFTSKDDLFAKIIRRIVQSQPKKSILDDANINEAVSQLAMTTVLNINSPNVVGLYTAAIKSNHCYPNAVKIFWHEMVDRSYQALLYFVMTHPGFIFEDEHEAKRAISTFLRECCAPSLLAILLQESLCQTVDEIQFHSDNVTINFLSSYYA